MGKDYNEKDLREIDYKKGKERFRVGRLGRGKFKGTVVEEKDARGAIHRPAKRILDGKGTLREVEFDYWKREVINNPTGPTASRAVKSKDPDLKEITIDVIGINHGESKDVKVTPIRTTKESKRTDLTCGAISPEEAKRRGFWVAETGKGGREKKGSKRWRRVKDESSKNGKES